MKSLRSPDVQVIGRVRLTPGASEHKDLLALRRMVLFMCKLLDSMSRNSNEYCALCSVSSCPTVLSRS